MNKNVPLPPKSKFSFRSIHGPAARSTPAACNRKGNWFTGMSAGRLSNVWRNSARENKERASYTRVQCRRRHKTHNTRFNGTGNKLPKTWHPLFIVSVTLTCKLPRAITIPCRMYWSTIKVRAASQFFEFTFTRDTLRKCVLIFAENYRAYYGQLSDVLRKWYNWRWTVG